LVLANILAKKRDRAGSVEQMRKYLKAAPNAPDADMIRARVRESERIAKAESGNPNPQ